MRTLADFQGRGDCFPVAAKLADALGPDYLLVHGLPRHRGPEAIGEKHTGKRHWHAWVETVDGLRVLDYANNLTNDVARPVYYAMGDLDEDVVMRYTQANVDAWKLLSGTYGPWPSPIRHLAKA